jgi:hypothetical protein
VGPATTIFINFHQKVQYLRPVLISLIPSLIPTGGLAYRRYRTGSSHGENCGSIPFIIAVTVEIAAVGDHLRSVGRSLKEDTLMILDRNSGDLLEKAKADAEAIVRSHVEMQLHPSVERFRSIADEWALKHWWTAQECAILFMGADPHKADVFTDPDFPIYLAASDREKFDRILDLIHRRFGDRVNPAEACRWAASIGMKQECLQQALAGREAEPHVANKRAQQPSKPRQEDTTKLDITRSKLISATAKSRKFSEGGRSSAVALFKKDLEKIGDDMNEQTIRDCLIGAEKHARTTKSFAEFYAEGRESRKVASSVNND